MVQASAKLAGTTLVSICHFRVLDDRSGCWPRADSRCLGEIAFQHLTFNFAKSKNTEIMGEEVNLYLSGVNRRLSTRVTPSVSDPYEPSGA